MVTKEEVCCERARDAPTAASGDGDRRFLNCVSCMTGVFSGFPCYSAEGVGYQREHSFQAFAICIDTLALSSNQYFSSNRLFTALKEACPLSVDATGEAYVCFCISRQSFTTEA